MYQRLHRPRHSAVSPELRELTADLPEMGHPGPRMACPIESSAHDQLLPTGRRHRTPISEMRCNALLSNTLLSALRAEVFEVRI
jgi:hypothetical protein